MAHEEFHLDFHDQFGNLHQFTLYNAKFWRVKIVKTTDKYVDAIYGINSTAIERQTSTIPGERLIWVNVLPVRSTLHELIPGSGNYSGTFRQNGKVKGFHYTRYNGSVDEEYDDYGLVGGDDPGDGGGDDPGDGGNCTPGVDPDCWWTSKGPRRLPGVAPLSGTVGIRRR